MALNKGIKKIAGGQLAISVAELHLPWGRASSHLKSREIGETIFLVCVCARVRAGISIHSASVYNV